MVQKCGICYLRRFAQLQGLYERKSIFNGRSLATMEFGYARVSTSHQNTDRQIEALLEYGIPERNIIVDKQSGKDFERVGYLALKNTMLPSRRYLSYQGTGQAWQKQADDKRRTGVAQSSRDPE